MGQEGRGGGGCRSAARWASHDDMNHNGGVEKIALGVAASTPKHAASVLAWRGLHANRRLHLFKSKQGREGAGACERVQHLSSGGSTGREWVFGMCLFVCLCLCTLPRRALAVTTPRNLGIDVG